MENYTKEKIKEMLENDEIGIIYPKEKSEEAATALANMIVDAIGVVATTDEDTGEISFGVMIKKAADVNKVLD